MKKAKPVKVVTRKPRTTWTDIDALVAYLNAAIAKVEEQEARFYLQEAEMRERLGRFEREHRQAAFNSLQNDLVAIARPSFWQRIKMALRRWR